jgi:hypothetical protein
MLRRHLLLRPPVLAVQNTAAHGDTLVNRSDRSPRAALA